MVGVWHDHLEAFDPDGTPVADDPHGGVPGPFPYDNLVYFDFDGSTVTQTNVTFRGREPSVRTFESDLVDGVLRFRRLGPEEMVAYRVDLTGPLKVRRHSSLPSSATPANVRSSTWRKPWSKCTA